MQIRAQLAAEGFPLYGDTLYSSLADSASSQVRQHRHQSARKDMLYICMTICAAQRICNQGSLVCGALQQFQTLQFVHNNQTLLIAAAHVPFSFASLW